MAIPLEKSLIYQELKQHVLAIACNPDAWLAGDNCEAPFAMDIIIRVFGRAEAEHVALMWNQAGRDDIAARIKDLIHQSGTRPKYIKKEAKMAP